jgi:hypothetical protein
MRHFQRSQARIIFIFGEIIMEIDLYSGKAPLGGLHPWEAFTEFQMPDGSGLFGRHAGLWRDCTGGK